MQKLVASLGLRAAIFVVISSILGSGVFKKVAVMASTLHSPMLILGCWVAAGIVSLAGALCTAEMAGMFPSSGGEYFYYQKVYNRFFAFLYGWSNFVVLKSAAIAALAYIFSESLEGLIPLHAWLGIPETRTVKILASLLIALLSYINVRGVKNAEMLTRVLTYLMLVACIAMIALGLNAPGGNWNHFSVSRPASIQGWGGWFRPFIIASLGAFWGYEGWNCVGLLGEEIRSPQKNLPWSLAIGTLIIMAVYLGLNLMYLYVMPIAGLEAIQARGNQIAAVQIMQSASGAWAGLAVSLLILVTTLNANNATVLTAARIYYAMARDGLFVPAAARVHARHKTPSMALWMQGGWSILLVWSGTFDQLTDMLVFSAFIFYGATALAVMIMRKKAPDQPRGYRVHLYPWTPLFFCLCCVVLITITLTNQPREAFAGLGLMAAGIPFYYFWKRKRPASDPTDQAEV